MGKLTRSMDKQVVSRAKAFAKLRGVSVSELVETYLAAVVAPTRPVTGATPVLRSVRGILKHADIEDCRKYLAGVNA
jgi:hypothetical protein